MFFISIYIQFYIYKKLLPTQIRAIFMKKFTYLFALIAISLCFVQCEKNKIGQNGVHKGHEYVDLGLSVKIS